MGSGTVGLGLFVDKVCTSCRASKEVQDIAEETKLVRLLVFTLSNRSDPTATARRHQLNSVGESFYHFRMHMPNLGGSGFTAKNPF